MSAVLLPIVNANGVYISGKFYGKYFYDNGSSSKFKGIIYQEGSTIWGECVDQNGSESTLTGNVDGHSVNFIKTYNKDNHQVQYSGRLIHKTNTVKGQWGINQDNIGSFTMTIRGNHM